MKDANKDRPVHWQIGYKEKQAKGRETDSENGNKNHATYGVVDKKLY